MPLKRRKSVAGEKGAGKPAPSKSGGIKKRTIIPEEPEVPEFDGELGDVVRAMSQSGDYGKPFIKGSSRKMDRERQRTGVLSLDLCLGGGWTKSSTGMLYGEKSSGKSTIGIMTIAQMMRDQDQGIAAWIDIEGTFDKKWAQKLGVDLERLLIVEPETGEHAVDLADAVLRSRETNIVVMDSIAMIVPMSEIDDSAEQQTMALQARLVGKFLRKTNNAILKERSRGHQPLLLNINQFRMKVGLTFGDPRTLPGGKALEFATTQQVEMKNKEHPGKDDDGNDVVLFNEHNFKITKNKGGGPMKEGSFKFSRTAGHDKCDGLPEATVIQGKTIYTHGMQCGLVSGAPSSFEVEGYGKFRGGPAYNRWAIDNPDAHGEIQQIILDRFREKWDL